MAQHRGNFSVDALLQRYVFSDKIPLKVRRRNMIAGLCFGMVLLTAIIHFFVGMPFPALASLLAVAVVIAIYLIFSNSSSNRDRATLVTLFIVCQILLPFVFFSNGGINGGMIAFFVVSVMVQFMMLTGKNRVIMLVIHAIVIVTCYELNIKYPDIALSLSPLQRLLASVYSIMIVGLFIGFTVFFQNRVYQMESERAATAIMALKSADQSITDIFDGNPLITVLFDENLNIIDCNQTLTQFLGFTDKKEVLAIFPRLMDEVVPPRHKDRQAAVSLRERLRCALDAGQNRFEAELDLRGQNLLLSVTMRKIPYGGRQAIVVYVMDMTDFYTVRDRLLYREKLLSAVNTMSEKLLSFGSVDPGEAIVSSMKIIARCIEVDRIYIWKKALIGGRIYYRQEYSWVAPEVAAMTSLKNTGAEARIKSIPEWESLFLLGQAINGPLSSFSRGEQERLRNFAIKSILVIPVFQQERLWGFVSFDDCHRERVFDAESETILRSVSLLMVNTILRNEITTSLVKAREDALASANAKSTFLANMSHEMRTPLNAVVGMTAIGKTATDSDRKDYCFAKIEDASRHLLGIINDVLDMSKIEANKLELSLVDFNFENMLQQVVEIINFRVDQKQQRFLARLDRHIPEIVRGDDQRIAQVITNLLSNANKFTPEAGAITLDARLVREEKGRCLIRVSVSDTGIGISPQQQALLFQSFQQADSDTTRKFGGTGLGLVISRRIVEKMNGEIWVESEPGQGSTFHFTAEVERVSTNNRRLSLGPGITRDNVRIMAVDDDRDMLVYFKNIMDQFELSCDLASSGEEALELRARTGLYNIYFVDWKMPGMDGIELSRRIRKMDEGNDNSIIIMISAMEWAGIADEARSSGVDKYIPKPLFPSAVADCIIECLGLNNLMVDRPASHPVTGIFQGRRILLAEDVEINREIVQALLEPTALAIDTAADGVEAVTMFCQNPEKYDLIFMDMQMPRMDGYEAARRIRALESVWRTENPSMTLRPIPIISMTANVFREDIEKCLAAGMNGHVGKPLDFDDVINILKMYLN